jgi:hypothetical protein
VRGKYEDYILKGIFDVLNKDFNHKMNAGDNFIAVSLSNN